jgi:hypothetical protein
MIEHIHLAAFLADIPNPPPQAPSGSKQIVDTVAGVKWGAGIALMLGFFAGLAVWGGGRWADHHRAGRVGAIMMICAVVGGLLYAIVPQIINTFANG